MTPDQAHDREQTRLARDYRDDDTNDAYCPICTKPLAGLTAALKGYCETHGWQFADWKTS